MDDAAVIVLAKAARYAGKPKPLQHNGMLPVSLIEFDIVDVLKGKPGRALRIPGQLSLSGTTVQDGPFVIFKVTSRPEVHRLVDDRVTAGFNACNIEQIGERKEPWRGYDGSTFSGARSRVPNTAINAGTVVTAPMATSVVPIMRRCLSLNFPARRSATPAANAARVPTTNINSGTVSVRSRID